VNNSHPTLATAPLLDRRAFEVACIYYPAYHPTPFMEAWHGFGWTEWEIAARARPRFPGHRQPLLPAWGAFDESDPAWSAREVEAAAGHGIDAWIFDWYWYAGLEIWGEALDRGFLRAKGRERMKFGLMWANHTWQDNHPASGTQPLSSLLPVRHSPEDAERVIDAWCERYFRQPNYWRIDGRPWCSFFQLGPLLDQLGGASGAGRTLERMRKRAQKNGEPDLYFGVFTGSPAEAKAAVDLGFDHTVTYNITRGRGQQARQAVVEYEDVILGHEDVWMEFLASGVPYWPVVSRGWDVSPRNHPYEPWPPVRWEWPWGHIVQGNTPARFGQLVQSCRRFMGLQKDQAHRAMVINAWNEWTESSVLLPLADEGDAALKALAEALK
jgi:hypothetical protein